jgi:glutamyl-tRNA(Gln) amidotransferase subunit E
MPLIETVTGPDMKTPFEVAEVGNICRRLVRSSGNVRTGIGAARQDVNVSVDGGTRIEIKGVPRIPDIPLLTYNEAMRQWNLLRLKAELEARGITSDSFESAAMDVTRLLRKTRYQPIVGALARGWSVRCVLLRDYGGLLRWETQTDTQFWKEISDRVRVIACLTELPNIIHSDSYSETLTGSEWRQLRKTANAGENDAIVVVWGPETDADTGAREIAIRAREAAIGVPSETRQALRDGTNGFERILPGPDRMYPDTDLPPKRITEERLERVRATLPEYFWDREAEYRRLGVPEDVVKPLSISIYAELFKRLVREKGADPTTASVALIQFTKRLRKLRGYKHPIPAELVEGIFDAFLQGRLAKDGILHAMDRAWKAKTFNGDALPPVCTPEELESVLSEETAAMSGRIARPDKIDTIITGRVMRRLRGRIAGAVVAERVHNKTAEAAR